MVYYDPSILITDPSDKLIDYCETKVKLQKDARLKARRSGKYFGPFLSMEWDAVIKATGELLILKQWADRVGKIEIDLLNEDKHLRKGHYNQKKDHTNPDNKIIPRPHHVHFPTVKYSSLNVQARKYAYPSKVNGNYIETIQKFCDESNIILKGNLPLWQKMK